MLDKTIVISNLRRFFVRVGSNANIQTNCNHNRSSGAEANPTREELETINETKKMPNIHLDIPHKAQYRGRGEDITDTESGASSAIMSQVQSSANLISYEEKEKKKDLRGRMRMVSERLSLSAAPDDLPLPAMHHRIIDCCGSWFSGLIRIPILLTLLYFFVCSLDFLSTAFRLIAGKTAGTIFQSSTLLANPIVGLMIAILFTVLVQSSSTCTSVIVSLVSSDILDVRMAIPMVMGANIGTSLTSTLVSLTQVTNKDQFERAFAGATVHDCFNWLTVITLLVLESTTGYLYHVTGWITQSAWSSDNDNNNNTEDSSSHVVSTATNVNILGALTKPFTNKIVQIDKDVLQCWGLGECQDERLLKIWCNKSSVTSSLAAMTSSLAGPGPDNATLQHLTVIEQATGEGELCQFLLNIPYLDDFVVGIILLIISLVVLSVCLVLIVKVLSALLKGTVAEMIKKTINSDIPYVPWLTGYIAILMGAILTFIVQSSSVFTTTLTPLVGVGLITVDRVYPLTLGSNLGTTTTAMIAALAAEGSERLRNSLQIALCHFFFNLSGILLFYPIPFMRWPLVLCKLLGRTTAQYRWFAVAYLIVMFFLLPGFVLSLSMAGPNVLFSVAGPILVMLTLVLIINLMQANLPNFLPAILRDWAFLPLWMRSLEPTDVLLRKLTCNFFCCSQYDMVPDGSNEPEECMQEAHPRIIINL